MSLKPGAFTCQLRLNFGTYGGGYDGYVYTTDFVNGLLLQYVEGILQDMVMISIGRAQADFLTSGFSYADKVHPVCGYITIVQEGEEHIYMIDRAYTGGDANQFKMMFNATKPRIL